jgi:hypothetical protein
LLFKYSYYQKTLSILSILSFKNLRLPFVFKNKRYQNPRLLLAPAVRKKRRFIKNNRNADPKDRLRQARRSRAAKLFLN